MAIAGFSLGRVNDASPPPPPPPLLTSLNGEMFLAGEVNNYLLCRIWQIPYLLT